MSEKKKDEFFNELDKTADLLRTFKPSVEQPKDKSLDEIEKLYNDLGKTEEQEKLERRRKRIEQNTLDAERLEKIQKAINAKLEKEKKEKQQEMVENLFSKEKKSSVKDKETLKEDNVSEEKEKGSSDPLKKEKRELTREEKIARIKAKRRRERALAIKAMKENEATKLDTKKVEKPSSKKKAKRKLKKGVFELLFCACSFLFMVGCIIFYGMRLVKYYKIYNPKNDSGEVLALLTTEIARNSSIVYEGSGLYMQGGEYIYKGTNVNNYVEYSNLLWRILKSNPDGTMDLILDDYINVLPFSKDYSNYTDSDIHKWLNEYFTKYLNKEYLTGTKICLDTVQDLNSYSCNSSDTSSFVRLLSVKEYLNSKADNTTYISNEESSLWLSTIAGEGAWQVNGNNLSIALESRALGIKPVVTLKMGVALLEGEGTKEKPYKIENEDNNIHIGDYVKLGEDTYVVYQSNDDRLSLALNNYLTATYRFDINNNVYNVDTMYSLAYYLNTIYYNSLPYKDKLLDTEWNTGIYTSSYKDIESTKLTAKIGLYSIQDLKFNNELSEYFLLNGVDTFSYLYGNELVTSKPNISRKVRPCITIQNSGISSGDGTLTNPYVVEG